MRSLKISFMEFNFPLKNTAKELNRESFKKVLIVRLPCNPIFPIGPIYLADHIHKCFPEIEQQFIDLAIVPLNKVSKYLKRKIDQFRPCLLYTSPSPRDRQKSRMPSSA